MNDLARGAIGGGIRYSGVFTPPTGVKAVEVEVDADDTAKLQAAAVVPATPCAFSIDYTANIGSGANGTALIRFMAVKTDGTKYVIRSNELTPN